jgi:hypothetical protein
MHAIIRLHLSEEIIKSGARVGVDGSAEGVVVAAETLENMPDEIIGIKRFSCSSKFRCNSFHLSKVLFSREIIFSSVIEGGAELLHPGPGC